MILVGRLSHAYFTGGRVTFLRATFAGGVVTPGRGGVPGLAAARARPGAGAAGTTGRIKGKLWSGLSVSSTSLLCIKRLVVEAFS
jgi:hypothetical protein